MQYITANIKQAATLMAMGATLVRFDASDPRVMQFVLEHPEIDRLNQEYITKAALVEPNTLWGHFSYLKTLVFETKRMP